MIGELAHECDASAVYWNRAYDPATRDRDTRIKRAFDKRGVAAEGLKANLLFEPSEITTKSGGPYKVFTAFWRACRTMPDPAAPLRAPRKLPAPGVWPSSVPGGSRTGCIASAGCALARKGSGLPDAAKVMPLTARAVRARRRLVLMVVFTADPLSIARVLPQVSRC